MSWDRPPALTCDDTFGNHAEAVGVGSPMRERGRRAGIRAVAVGIAIVSVVGVVGIYVVGPAIRWLGADVCEASGVALIRAAARGDVGDVDALLRDGADPNEEDQERNTALGCAIPYGHDLVVLRLLGGGADPNRETGSAGFMEVPLGLALREGTNASIVFLVVAGADPNRQDCSGVVFDAALDALTASPHQLRDAPDASPGIAVDPRLVAALVDRGADPSGRADIDGEIRVPLARSVVLQDPELVRRLLDHGADPDGVPSARPVVAAARTGNLVALDRLLAAGADLRLPSAGPGSPTVGAAAIADAFQGSPEIRGRLVAATSNADAGGGTTGIDGIPPLVSAAGRGATDEVIYLVEHGNAVDGGLVDADQVAAVLADLAAAGVSPFHLSVLAAALNPPPLSANEALPGFPLLLAAVADGTATAPEGTAKATGDPGRLDACRPDPASISTLPSTQIPPPPTWPPGMPVPGGATAAAPPVVIPPIALAAVRKDRATVQLLLDHGADPDGLVGGKVTPLYLAVSGCDLELAGILLAHGADPTFGDPAFQPAGPAC